MFTLLSEFNHEQNLNLHKKKQKWEKCENLSKILLVFLNEMENKFKQTRKQLSIIECNKFIWNSFDSRMEKGKCVQAQIRLDVEEW